MTELILSNVALESELAKRLSEIFYSLEHRGDSTALVIHGTEFQVMSITVDVHGNNHPYNGSFTFLPSGTASFVVKCRN